MTRVYCWLLAQHAKLFRNGAAFGHDPRTVIVKRLFPELIRCSRCHVTIYDEAEQDFLVGKHCPDKTVPEGEK